MSDLLVIFDVDGTLVDGQGQIVSAMQMAFAQVGLEAPMRADILSVIGLSLPEAFAKLVDDQSADVQADLVRRYKQAFFDLRKTLGEGTSPLYEGARETLHQLADCDEVFLGICTGKSRRGLEYMLQEHKLQSLFHTTHPADQYPSKPHPAMIEAALADVGLDPSQTVMVGDTSYDMDMARYANVAGIGATWGYHPPHELRAAGAETVLTAFKDLIPYLQKTGRLR